MRIGTRGRIISRLKRKLEVLLVGTSLVFFFFFFFILSHPTRSDHVDSAPDARVRSTRQARIMKKLERIVNCIWRL